MNMTARRLRSIGWIATLVVCAALVMVLAFRVNALRSQVHQSDARIIALKQETMYLETEFETRANQQQLKTWNDIDFGYAAPTATQYLDNERQLASYAKPVEPDAPAPVRVASADDGVAAAAAFPAMVSPMTGKPTAAASDAATAPASDAAADRAHHDDDAAPVKTKHKTALAAQGLATQGLAGQGLAGLADRLATVKHGDGAAKTDKTRSAKAKPAKPAKDAASKSAKAAVHDHQTAKAHLASAAQPADHHRAKPLITLALKDAQSIK